MGDQTYVTAQGDTLYVRDCEDKGQLHTCPQRTEIEDDYSLCNCGEEDEDNCRSNCE